MTCRTTGNRPLPSDSVVRFQDYATQDEEKRRLCAGENFIRLQEIVEICVDHVVCAFVVGLGVGYCIWGL